MFLSFNINWIRNLDFYESNIALINSVMKCEIITTQVCRLKNSATKFIGTRNFILNLHSYMYIVISKVCLKNLHNIPSIQPIELFIFNRNKYYFGNCKVYLENSCFDSWILNNEMNSFLTKWTPFLLVCTKLKA